MRCSDWSSDVCSSDRAHIGGELLGSLAWTGAGHATDKAVILGLAGFEPDTIEPAIIDEIVEQARATRRLHVAGRDIAFNPAVDIVFDRKSRTPVHPNPLTRNRVGWGKRV